MIFQSYYSDKVCPSTKHSSRSGRVRSEFLKDTIIENVIDRYHKTGFVEGIKSNPVFDDFYDAKSFHESANIIAEASRAFYDLPSNVRERFGNDPSKLLDFLDHSENRDEAIELGIIPPDPPPSSPIEVVVAGAASDNSQTPQAADSSSFQDE